MRATERFTFIEAFMLAMLLIALTAIVFRMASCANPDRPPEIPNCDRAHEGLALIIDGQRQHCVQVEPGHFVWRSNGGCVEEKRTP